jgi:hypothetical protein
MNNTYTPRKKKAVKPIVKMKYVRVDHKTLIEVPLSVPDDVARENYLSRLNIPVKGKFQRLMPNTPNMPVKHEFKDEEIVDQEMEEVLSDIKAETEEE